MEYVPSFINRLREKSEPIGYDRVAAFFDGDFARKDKFTALGSLYMVHHSISAIAIYDFKVGKVHTIRGRKYFIKVPLD